MGTSHVNAQSAGRGNGRGSTNTKGQMAAQAASADRPPLGVSTAGQGKPRLEPGMVDRLLMTAVLAMVTIFLIHGWYQIGELGFDEDESRNAVTGLYFADFLTDLPISHPVEYTYRYYAQYPALGIMHWPPFFHFTEGLMFLSVGRSIWTARLTMLLFVLLGLFFWFKLVQELSDSKVATFATSALFLVPQVFLYSRAVMLEVPSLALCLVASYLWVRLLRTGRRRLLYWFAVAASLALLTKEHSIYLAAFCALTVLAERKWSLVLNWTGARAFFISAALVIPYYMVSFKVHGTSIKQHIVQARPYNWGDLAFYWAALPRGLGWPVVVLSAMGVVTLFAWRRGRRPHLMLLWAAAFYLTFTFLRAREDRYSFYWLPPFVLLASWPLMVPWRSRWARVLAIVICALVFGDYGWRAWNARSYPYFSGYSTATKWLATATQGPQVLLFDGENNGDFIFLMRVHDPNRRFIILRKGLYVTRLVPFFGSRQLVQTPEQLRQLLAEYGIRYIVVSDNPQAILFPSQTLLRRFLQDPQFKLVQKFPVEFHGWYDEQSNRLVVPGQQSHLLVYENQQATPPTSRYLRIPMMTLNRDIVVPLDELGGRK
jgi:4-amino-4-deoxy-L-arabinose transferase-like glycosyltransferase